MKSNPDDRSDNVKNIQKNLDCTIENIELANEMIDQTSDNKMKKVLAEKNERRVDAIDAMCCELEDEERHQKCKNK